MSKESVSIALSHFGDSPTRLALAIGGKVKRQNVEHWARAGSVPVEYCAAVERLTGGLVRRWALREFDWWVIWPELIGTPDAPALPESAAAGSAEALAHA